MKSAAFWISLAVSCVGGICCAELTAHSIVLRDKLGTICGRGHLLRSSRPRDLSNGSRSSAGRGALRFRDGSGRGTKIERQSALTDLITNIAVQSRATWEIIPRTEMTHELNLLRSQFRDDKTWRLALNGSDLSESSLWRMLRNDLRSRQWISKQIGHQLEITDDECRRFYDSHSANFFVPERLRVSHLFLAAPPETALEIVEANELRSKDFPFVWLAAKILPRWRRRIQKMRRQNCAVAISAIFPPVECLRFCGSGAETSRGRNQSADPDTTRLSHSQIDRRPAGATKDIR